MALLEFPATRLVFGTDYPQEIRQSGIVKTFVDGIKAIGADGDQILSGNASMLLKGRV